MKVVIDIEANGLTPTQIWVIVCKDIDTGELYIFRNLTTDAREAERFLAFAQRVTCFIGHNVLEYDYPAISRLLGLKYNSPADYFCDTLIISKLVDYPRQGHSLEDYGQEFGLEKIKFNDWSKYSLEMETYCIRDVEINHKVYLKYLKYISNPERKASILLEHKFQLIVNSLHENGFSFNTKKATDILNKVNLDLGVLDSAILKEFPPKQKLVREFTPRLTKHGTIAKNSVPRTLQDKIHEYEAGKIYPVYALETFNPASHKQIISVLNEAGWSPTDKTQTHIDTEREVNKLKRIKKRPSDLDLRLQECYTKLKTMGETGWKINETNLATLPKSAPSPARTLAQRILLESRRRTLTEWLGLVRPDTDSIREDTRIHGRFYGIGAWTHRMAHQKPNTANIPNEFDTQGNVKLLGKQMRSLWQAPKNRLLVGVDAEGIQLRIFAHYIDDPEFTKALVEGKKEDKSDPHSLNQSILGSVCKSRAAAKRFIYALLLGAGIGKLTQILEGSQQDTELALERLLGRYKGFAYLKDKVIPSDAKRGWFVGLDGRAVSIPGESAGERRHLCMSGYLQNGEAVVMKMATLHWYEQLTKAEITMDRLKGWMLVNFVHDEWQTECANDMEVAMFIAKTQSDALRIVGEQLNLKCPLAGSFYNDDLKDYTIATNWSKTH